MDWANALVRFSEGYQGTAGQNDLLRQEAALKKEELSQERKKAWILDMDQAVSLAEAGDVGGAQALLQNRIENVDRLNGDPQHSAGMLRLLQEGKVNEFVAGAKPIVERGKVEFGLNGPDEPANVREYKYYASLTPEQQAQYREMKRAQQLIETGGGAQAVVGGGVATPVTTSPGQTVDQFRAEYAGAEANLEGSKQRAKTWADLETQWQLSPGVEAAKRDAVIQVETLADLKQEEKSNARVLETYDLAMSGLVKSLGGTTTGPGMSWIAGLTESGQIAKGAIAAMAPVLKSIFREAGEGTFTKEDQQILMDMLPTIDDLPAARIAKARNVDMIVRAKLGGSIGSNQKAPASSSSPQNEDIPVADGTTGATTGGYEVGKTYTDANGSKAVYMGGGNWKEIQ